MLLRRQAELSGEGLPRDGDPEEEVVGVLPARGLEPGRQLGEVEVGADGLEQAAAVYEVVARTEGK